MSDQPGLIAGGLGSLQEALAGVGIDDDASGEAADAIRVALAQRGDHLGEIATAMRAVAAATKAREALLSEREAVMPTDSEIQVAQQAVIAAAGTADEQAAIDRLADLMTQKHDAQKTFERGEQVAADGLDTAGRDLRMPGSSGGSPASALAPLMGVLSSLSRVGAGAPGSGMPAAGEAAAGAPTAFSPDGPDPVGTLVDHLEGDDQGNGGRGRHHRLDFGSPEFGPGAGQTHTAGSESVAAQMPTLSGVMTGADVSGRGAAAFTVAPVGAGPVGGGGSAGGAGMAPMMPPMGGAAGGGGGAAQGKRRDKTTILNDDPGFTGADIESEIGTSGVIGRGEGHRPRTGGIA